MLRAVYLFLALIACAPESTAATAQATPPEMEQAEAVFAGGCFWCMEKPFESVPGVLSVTSGYSGGEIEGPTYAQVSSHATKHLEAIRVVYDPERINYERLLEVFWHNIDPTQGDGQFCDRGHQYTSAIFVRTPEERAAATASKEAVQAELGRPVVTDIRDAQPFWVAEAYHQDFYKTNPTRYERYRKGCGRGTQAGH
ncbi:MAG: peptide-methionine (S)-S-oxide reductase MsrA [Deltaproteobacteria bacterium]|nr:peptide-methionine (S)-S-oxide reductase MsrA [Deltaproteobacteria bacterium]